MSEAVQVKICGLTRREDVLAADKAGADFVGVVVSQGFGRSVAPGDARRLVDGTAATPVAVMVNESPAWAAEAVRSMGAGVAQLHGDEPPESLRALRAMGCPRIWKAVRLRVPEDLLNAIDAYRGLADGLLVEGWKEGVVGGGGVRADLQALAGIRDRLPPDLALVLAGGLTPDTVANAVAQIRPSVVDVSSGVEVDLGIKSANLIKRFVDEARRPSVDPKGVPHA